MTNALIVTDPIPSLVPADLPYDPPSGVTYDAIKADIAAKGQLNPIHCTPDGVVMTGRAVLRACQELGLAPRIEVVADGIGAVISDLTRRDFTPMEKGRFFHWLWEQHRDRVAGSATGRRNEILSTFAQTRLGMSRGASPRQVASYFTLAGATPEEAEAVSAAGADVTLPRALNELNRIRAAAITITAEQSAAIEGVGRERKRLQLIDRLRASLAGNPVMTEAERRALTNLRAELDVILAQPEVASIGTVAVLEPTFVPRRHQVDLVAQAGHELAACKRCLLIEGPTGSGKTLTLLLLVATAIREGISILQKPSSEVKVLWLGCSNEVVGQAAAANRSAQLVPDGQIIFLSAFSAAIPHADILVVDEAHHDSAATLVRARQAVTPQIVLGASATPDRADRFGLAFDSILRTPDVNNLIDQGVLASFDHYTHDGHTPESVTGFYLGDRELWGPTVMFFHTIAEAEHAAHLLRQGGIPANAIIGDSNRAQHLLAFTEGLIHILTAVNTLTEGFDAPRLKTVFARDAGRGMTIQMCGRALRRFGDKRANIVQSEFTSFLYTREATPVRQFRHRNGRWNLCMPPSSERSNSTRDVVLVERTA